MDSLSDEERARAIARFRCMHHRGTRVVFVAVGPVVRAKSPVDLKTAAPAWKAGVADANEES